MPAGSFFLDYAVRVPPNSVRPRLVCCNAETYRYFWPLVCAWRVPAVLPLCRWASKHGATVCSTLRVRMKKSGRCYLRSVRSIPAHTPLISIPRSLCIECSTGPTFQGSFSATAVLANRLSRYLHDPRSLYRRYAEFLHDIHNMEGDDAGLAAEDPRTVVLQQQLDDFYAGNVLHAKGVANAPFLPKESISTPRLRRDWGKIHCIVREVRQAVPHFAAPSVPWAVSMVLARSRLLHDGQTAMLSMMPMIDLAEHSYQPNSILHCTANSRDSKNCGVRWHDDSVPCLHLVSTRDIGKGEPISVSYTPRPAVTLEDQEYWQLTWGFVPSGR